jgi:hypothetical protein
LGLLSWLLEYFHKPSCSKGRKIGCLILISLSVVIFLLSNGLRSISFYSGYIGYPVSFLALWFGLGFRIGKGAKYLLYGLIIIVITVIIFYIASPK